MEEARRDEKRRREQQSGKSEVTLFDGFGRRAQRETVEAWEQWFEYVDQVIWGPIDEDGEDAKPRRRTTNDDEDEVTY